MMNTRDMQIFAKIADYQSITRAAEDIQMTQPAVSSTLKRIEEELGYPLFIRRGKRLILNEQGRVFYNATQELFGEIAQLHGSIQTGNPQKEELIIKVCTYSDKLYQLLGVYAKENPAIRIILRQANAAKREVYRFEDFTVKKVGEEAAAQNYLPLESRGGIYAILPDCHPLASCPQLTLSDLKKQKFVFLRDNADSGMESVYEICIRAGFVPDVSMIVDTLSTKYSAIRRGCGIGLVFEDALSLAALIKDCRLLPVSVPMMVDWVGLYWNDDILSETGKNFLSFIRERM